MGSFLAKIADARRREDCQAIAEMMRGATGEDAEMWGPSIVGFGRYKMKYADGREAEWPVIGFSPRKKDLTLYISASRLPKGLLKRLGKHKTGGSCLYIKTLGDVDRAVLKALMEKSVEGMEAKRVR